MRLEHRLDVFKRFVETLRALVPSPLGDQRDRVICDFGRLFRQTSRRIATPSNVQVRRPLYRSSLSRWRRYEAYLQPLLAELGPLRRPE